MPEPQPTQWWPSAAIDFDGTLYDDNYPEVGPIKPGAKEAMQRLRDAKVCIIIYTCRALIADPNNPVDAKYVDGSQRSKIAMREALQRDGVPYDIIWDRPGKPYAFVYCDDKNVRFEESWTETIETLMKMLDNVKHKD